MQHLNRFRMLAVQSRKEPNAPASADKKKQQAVPHLSLSGEEQLHDVRSFVRILFWEEVATLYRLPLHLRSPLPPYAERTAVFCIVSVNPTAFRPQVQHRAFNFFRRFFVRAVVFNIDRRCSSIFLTDTMHAG